MILNHTIYNEETDTETEVELRVIHHKFRKGDGVGAFFGPTADEPEEVILEEIHLNGEILDESHPFYDMITEDELVQLVHCFYDSIAEGAYRGEL